MLQSRKAGDNQMQDQMTSLFETLSVNTQGKSVKEMNGTSNYSMMLNVDAGQAESVKVDFLNLKKAAMILRALNHKLRQQIVKIIDENKRLTVTEIYVRLRLEQSVASQHLAILRRAGIVKTTRDGKYIFYTVSIDKVKQIVTCVEDLTG